jgi:hypothetical protein
VDDLSAHGCRVPRTGDRARLGITGTPRVR